MIYHFNKRHETIFNLCKQLLDQKPLFMSGAELSSYIGYTYKQISQAIIVAQKNGNCDIINCKGMGYVSTKWLDNKKVRYYVKRQVNTLQSEALDDLRVANHFKELLEC